MMLHKGRLELAPQVADHFGQMLNEYRGIATAEVTSAVPLNIHGAEGDWPTTIGR